jgi:hypothetical protein
MSARPCDKVQPRRQIFLFTLSNGSVLAALLAKPVKLNTSASDFIH